MKRPVLFSFITFLPLTVSLSQAASLQVTPVSLEIAPPGATSTISLRNEGAAQISTQIRVFRWTQSNGVERLEPTAEVVASPPAVSLQPGANYAVRIIRLNKAPVAQEEAYRLLVDELPDPNRQRNGSISLVVRYSVPVFFASPESTSPQLTWTVENKGGKISTLIRNDGGRHIRLSALKVKDSSGHAVSFGEGLAGYVLADATMRLSAAQRASGFSGGQATISAMSDLGPVNVSASLKR